MPRLRGISLAIEAYCRQNSPVKQAHSKTELKASYHEASEGE